MVIKKKEVIEYAETFDGEYGNCVTCKHYQDLITCSSCSRKSRYCFDWKHCLKENQSDIIEYLKGRD